MADTPLSDITIIDLTHARAGPWCTQILGELGAEVIKIERPDTGDMERGSYPEQGGIGMNFISRNRNKKSVVINLKTPEGRQLGEDLIRDADVLVENMGPGALDRLGIGYEYLSTEVNPGLVYLSIKGYGEEGPYKDRKGVDLVMQAEAGIMSVTGPEGGPPVKVGQAIGDIGAGLYGTIGILTALRRRDETGHGQKVETNLFGTIVSFMEEYLTMYGITGENPTPYGTRHQTSVPYELFDTKDGQMVLHVPSRQWETVTTDVLDAPELAEHTTTQQKQEHYDEIMDVLRPAMRERTTEEWIDTFGEIGCPVGPLNHVSDVIEHPHARAREYVFEYDDPNVGEVILHGHPLHFSEDTREIRSGIPHLGQHTDEILTQRLGITPDQLADYHADGIIQTHHRE